MGSGIRALAVCVCTDEDKVLVELGYDSVKRERYYRAIGGGIEFGERALRAVQREYREELSLELSSVRLAGVLENLFSYEGAPGHEVVFVFLGTLEADDTARRGLTELRESDGTPHRVLWKTLAEIREGSVPFYPDGILELCERELGST